MRILFILIPFFVFASDFIIKYQNLKPYYYKNQIVNLNIKVISPYPNVMFLNSSNTQINISQITPYIYELNTTFKADNKNKSIEIYTPEESQIINLNKIIKTKPLNKIKNFSGVFANNLNILNPIASQYDTNHTILSFTIKCKNCNIEDFNLTNEQNLTIISSNEASYYIILPKNQKKLTFFYYNLKEEKFKKIVIPIILKEETISTQTQITPSENKFFTPLNILLLVLIAITLLIFIIFQKIFILIFPIIFAIFIGLEFIPKGEITLKPGMELKILPTKNSTTFYIIKTQKKAKILNKRGKYIKVKINNKIGWVYENN